MEREISSRGFGNVSRIEIEGQGRLIKYGSQNAVIISGLPALDLRAVDEWNLSRISEQQPEEDVRVQDREASNANIISVNGKINTYLNNIYLSGSSSWLLHLRECSWGEEKGEENNKKTGEVYKEIVNII